MPIRAIYVKLSPREMRLLDAMAEGEHRTAPDQAAHLVSQAIRKWSTDKALEALVEDDLSFVAPA
jgi:hypothetical protein